MTAIKCHLLLWQRLNWRRLRLDRGGIRDVRPSPSASRNSGKQCCLPLFGLQSSNPPTTPPNVSGFISSLHASLHIFPQTETGIGIEIARDRDGAMWQAKVSCCEFHFRCDILLQNFIFNLCTYYTQHATPSHRPNRSAAGPLIWLLFLFLVKLFYFCHGNCLGQPEIRKAASVRVQVRVYLSSSGCTGFQLWFHPATGAVDYYYKHYDRISLG